MTAVQPSARPLGRVRVGGAGWDFNAAHTGLHDGVLESMHGHTYQVLLTAWGLRTRRVWSPTSASSSSSCAR